MAYKYPSPIGIADGGTGASNAADARDNLGISASSTITWSTGQTWADFYALYFSAGPRPVTVLVEGITDRTIPAGTYDVTGASFVGIGFIDNFNLPKITFLDGAQFTTTNLWFKDLEIKMNAVTMGILTPLAPGQGLNIFLDHAVFKANLFTALVPAINLNSASYVEHRVVLINETIIGGGGSPASSLFFLSGNDDMYVTCYHNTTVQSKVFKSTDFVGVTLTFDESSIYNTFTTFEGNASINSANPFMAQAGNCLIDNLVAPPLGNTVQAALDTLRAAGGAQTPVLKWTASAFESWATFYARITAVGGNVIIYVDGDLTIDAGTYDFSKVLWINAAAVNPVNYGEGVLITLSEGVVLSPATLKSRNVNWQVAATATQLNSGALNFDIFGGGLKTLSASFHAIVAPASVTNSVRLDGYCILSNSGVSAIRLAATATMDVYMDGSAAMDGGSIDSAAAGPVVTFYLEPSCHYQVDPGDTATVTRSLLRLGLPNVHKVISGASYTFKDTETIVEVKKTTGSATAIVLPDPTLIPSEFRYVKDAKGDALLNNITITTPAGLIDGAASSVIAVNFGFAGFYSDGSNYYVISKFLI